MMRTSMLLGVWLALGAAHCSGSESPGDTRPDESSGGETSSGGSETSSGGSETGSGGSDDTGGTTGDPRELNGCKASAYEDRSADDADRTVVFPVRGLNYGPRCMTIAVGQTVHWEGRLNTHPLYPGNAEDPNAGSPDSPIAITSSGSSVEFTFDEAGTFPYWCEIHSDGPGTGMAGVIHVRAEE